MKFLTSFLKNNFLKLFFLCYYINMYNKINTFENKKEEENGVFEKNGEYFFYLGKIKDFIKIPKEVYQIIKIGLYAEKRNQRDNKNANDQYLSNFLMKMLSLENSNNPTNTQYEDKRENKYKKTKKLREDFNCHKTVFYSQKDKIDNFSEKNTDWNQLNIKNIKNKKEINNIKELNNYIENQLDEEKFGIGQVIEKKINSKNVKEEAIHSFFIGITESDKKIIFEKIGYGNEPFQISSINDIFNRYNNDIFIKEDWGDGISSKILYTIIPYSDFEKILKNNN